MRLINRPFMSSIVTLPRLRMVVGPLLMWFSLISGFSLMMGFLCLAYRPEVRATPEVRAASAMLMDFSTGQVLYEKNPHKRVPPASITKIMTMLIAMEEVDAKRISLDDIVRTSTYASQMGGSQIWLKEGEEMRLYDLMKAIAIVSANDACVATAEHIAGSEEDFVRSMNRRARELGMRDTHFTNCSGLPDPDHYTSAYDIALMARALLKHPEVLRWSSTWVDYLERPGVPGGRSFLRNTNELILRYRGADGLKTGMTEEAGYCLAGTAKRDDWRLLAVIMGADSNEARLIEVTKLLDYGFRTLDHVVVARKGERVGKVRVTRGAVEFVDSTTGEDLVAIVEKGKQELVDRILKPLQVEAPIRKGQKIGEVVASLDGRELTKVDALAAQDVGRANIFVIIFRTVKDFFARLLGGRG